MRRPPNRRIDVTRAARASSASRSVRREERHHLAADHRDAAIRWTIGVFDAVDRLAEFPESGRVVPELETRRVRELIFGAQGDSG
jgi:plasmid stabilization system protein ParE